jgi:hypothetical protein
VEQMQIQITEEKFRMLNINKFINNKWMTLKYKRKW